MSDYQHKENSGSALENKKKKSERSPDYTGKLNVEGVLFYISTWQSTVKGDMKRLGFAVERVEDKKWESKQ